MPETTPIRHTFGAPRGSVRALLALCVAGSAYWLLSHNAPMPDDLVGSLLIVFGYYFADRSNTADIEAAKTRAPLWLPEGTVRVLLVAGFAAAVLWLYWSNATVDIHAPVFAVVVTIAAFITGRGMKHVLLSFANQGKTTAAAVIGDAKGAVAILAGAGCVFVFCVPDLPLPSEWRARFADSLPSVVSFYFGTR